MEQKQLDKNTEILIVGLGLIGGSYAMALHEKGYRVSAIDKNAESIDFALRNGYIDRGYTVPDPEAIGRSELIVLSLYPHILVDWVRENQRYFRPGVIVTDVTGVKSGVVDKVQDMLRPDAEFIAAHPMAGRERYGVQNSDGRIFSGANYIVVPTESNTEDAIAVCRSLGATLGFARITELSVEDHDRMIGFVSQLTHCIAISLMTCSDNTYLSACTGDSFRDLTRIARINEEMWSELFLLNRDTLLREIDVFVGELSELRELIRRGDREKLMDKMRLSTERRAVFDRTDAENREISASALSHIQANNGTSGKE